MGKHNIRVAAFFLLVTACASTSATTSSTTPAPTVETNTTVATTAAPATTQAPITTTTAAADAAPPELEGSWRTLLGSGESRMLSLRGNQGVFNQPGGGGVVGEISVEGDRITFFESELCVAAGTWQWSIEGDSLTFTAVDPIDPCGSRRQVLEGVTYNR